MILREVSLFTIHFTLEDVRLTRALAWKENGSGSSIFYSKMLKPETEHWRAYNDILVNFMQGKDLPVVCHFLFLKKENSIQSLSANVSFSGRSLRNFQPKFAEQFYQPEGAHQIPNRQQSDGMLIFCKFFFRRVIAVI